MNLSSLVIEVSSWVKSERPEVTPLIVSATGRKTCPSYPESSEGIKFAVRLTDGSFQFVGPETVVGFGNTRHMSTTVIDSVGNPVPVIQTVINDAIISITTDRAFTPLTLITGFTSFVKGVNLSTSSTPFLNAGFLAYKLSSEPNFLSVLGSILSGEPSG